MTPTELNALTNDLFQLLCAKTSSPADGMHVITSTAYVIWRNAPGTYPLDEFCQSFTAAIKELHLVNGVKGSA